MSKWCITTIYENFSIILVMKRQMVKVSYFQGSFKNIANLKIVEMPILESNKKLSGIGVKKPLKS